VRQQSFKQAKGQPAGRVGRQRSEQGPALGDPAEPALEHGDGEIVGDQIADDQGQQRPVGGDLSAEEDAGEFRSQALGQDRLQQRRRSVEDGKGAAGDGDSRRSRRQALGISGHREVTDLAAGSHPGLR